MPKRYPSRPIAHKLATKSENFFRAHLPHEWTINPIHHDYGQDLYVEICEAFQMNGLGLIIQLKSSQISKPGRDYVTINLATTTYNYLKRKLDVVLLIKYIEDVNQAYWLLLKNVTPPLNEAQLSFTIRIPKENNLETIDWNYIVTYVSQVAQKKLDAWNG